jgi:hypothetical protein
MEIIQIFILLFFFGLSLLSLCISVHFWNNNAPQALCFFLEDVVETF